MKIRIAVVTVALLLSFLQRSRAQAPASSKEVSIQIHADKPAASVVPRTIFGSFLEPIGNSTYNGLWAEILQNPSFEENLWSVENIATMVQEEPSLKKASQLGLPLPWEPLDESQGNRYEPRWNEAANSWRSLEIIGLPDRPTGVKQKVFLPAHRELQYRGSLYVKHLTGPLELQVSLRVRNHPEQLLAKAAVTASTSEWSKYPFTLTIPEGAVKPLESVDFVIQVTGEERVLIDQASLMPADAIEGLDRDMVTLAKEMSTPLVRFGGNFTSGYHWRDGIGERDKRITKLNIAWGIPEYNQFGTDEFLHFCDLIGAEPQIALNLGSGTPTEAGEWVQYVDQQAAKHSGLIWELGNELWGNWNLGSPTLQELPARTLAFSQAVRSVDPNARLIATGQDPDHFQQWNAAQLSNPPNTFNYLSTHFVVPTEEIVNADLSPDIKAAAAIALPVELGRKLKDMAAQIDTKPDSKGRVRLAFTEWLFISNDKPQTVNYSNMGGALAAAGMFNMLLQNTDIVPISDMTGIVEFAGMWKKQGIVYAAPSYYAFRMYSTASANQLVEVDSNGANYQVEGGVKRFPVIKDVPYLDVTAALSKDQNRLTLFFVNRDLTNDTAAKVSFPGFAASANAKVQVLSSPSIYDENDAAHPRMIVPIESSSAVQAQQLHYTFRHASVTRIDLVRK